MIDQDKVRRFWDARASTYRTLPFESVANLEQDAKNLSLKIEIESAKVFAWLGLLAGKSILDLGSGVGQWAFRFLERGAAEVTAVEASPLLADICRSEARKRAVQGLTVVTEAAEKFSIIQRFDVIFISGLLVYMNDDQAECLVGNLPIFAHDATRLLLRDGTGLGCRYEINDRWSEHLQTSYSATYRTREDYVSLFEGAGFLLERDEDMFEVLSPLNKYPETRLRLYSFSRGVIDAEG